MAKYIVACLFMFSHAYAQHFDYVREVNDIALSDQLIHTRIMTASATISTSSSNDFDVKYYRCEWEIDPAIRYIRGIVTIYYPIGRCY